jgi:chromate transporter
MSAAAPIAMQAADWLHLLAYYLSLSLLTVGGAIATAPDMHRFLVDRQAWLTDPQFNASIAIAQAAPGPNVLFIGLLGWNVGLNAGGWALGLLGMVLCLVGVMLPSTLLTWGAARWAHRNRGLRAVRAFKQGMTPVVLGLLLATAFVLGTGHGSPAESWRLWAVSAACMLLVWRTRIHLLWLLGAGAVLGAVGWI